MTSTPDESAQPDSTSDPSNAQLAEQVQELATQLARLQIQTHPVLAQLTSIAARLTTVEDRTEDIGTAMDIIEELLATVAVPAAAAPADPWSVAGDGAAPAFPTDTSAADPAAGGEAEADGGVGLDLRLLVEWVRNNVAVLLERKIPQTQGGMHWCPQWWQHAEAIARFEALRRCWIEAVASPEGAGLAVYFSYLDHHLAVLTGETGPFSFCTRGTHMPGRATQLGHDEPDERYFLDFDDIRDALAS